MSMIKTPQKNWNCRRKIFLFVLGLLCFWVAISTTYHTSPFIPNSCNFTTDDFNKFITIIRTAFSDSKGLGVFSLVPQICIYHPINNKVFSWCLTQLSELMTISWQSYFMGGGNHSACKKIHWLNSNCLGVSQSQYFCACFRKYYP